MKTFPSPVWYDVVGMAQRHKNGGSSSRTARDSGASSSAVKNAGARARAEAPAEEVVGVGAPSGRVKAWLDANQSPPPGSGREPFRIPSELVTQSTDPALLQEKPG